MTLEQVGNTINVAGIAIALWSFWAEHRARRLHDLFPPVTKAWRWSKVRVLRLLGRDRPVTVSADAALHVMWSGEASLLAWRPMSPDADPAVTVSALVENLESLRAHVDRLHEDNVKRTDQVGSGLRQRVESIESERTAGDAREREIETNAMRGQTIGLVLALVGSLLSLLG
jgi:hypothetical protein